MSVIPIHSEVKSSSNMLDTTEIGLSSTPHDTVREKESKALRKRAAHHTSLTLPLEEHLPSKSINYNTVATTSTAVYKVCQNPPLLLGMNTLGKL